MSVHKETKTYTSPDGTTTTTTTTTSYYSSSSSGNIPKNLQEFTSHFSEDPFSEDFFKKYVENGVPSHGQIKKVNYEKKSQPDDLPDDFNLYVKPTEKVDFQSSACTGRKKAVLVGIKYNNTEYELEACVNDAYKIKMFITENYGFEESNMKILTDDQLDPELFPTRENIIKAIKWLVHDPHENDSYFFYYSGHGGQIKDEAGDEEDGFSETIMPIDFMTRGQIIDCELHALMVAPLPKGVRLTVVFDCCHSGTVLNLPYIYSTRGVIKESNILSLGGKSLLNASFSYIKGDKNSAITTLKEMRNTATTYQKLRRKNIETRGSPADVIMFSACKDNQEAHEAEIGDEDEQIEDEQIEGEQIVTGAMSFALITSLEENKHPTYQQLLNSIREVLKTEFAQKPQLSTSHEMNMCDTFTM